MNGNAAGEFQIGNELLLKARHVAPIKLRLPGRRGHDA